MITESKGSEPCSPTQLCAAATSSSDEQSSVQLKAHLQDSQIETQVKFCVDATSLRHVSTCWKQYEGIQMCKRKPIPNKREDSKEQNSPHATAKPESWLFFPARRQCRKPTSIPTHPAAIKALTPHIHAVRADDGQLPHSSAQLLLTVDALPFRL